eukprot:8341948-Pyramimonas_sp.AAC.1
MRPPAKVARAGWRQANFCDESQEPRPTCARAGGWPTRVALDCQRGGGAAAEGGAWRAQLPGSVVAEVCATYDLTMKVQKHLIAVALHIVSRAPRLCGPSSKAARAAEAVVRGKGR